MLGVYVVGAIDPAERAVVDEHLGECPSCRDELAGLAGLPAMLSRVPAADVERLSLPFTELPGPTEPSPELLNSLLRRVSATHRTRMWRSVAAVAAAAVIAAGGAAAATDLARSAQAGWEVAQGASASTHVGAVIDYQPTAFGTAMRVQVSGIKRGTTCRFWVIGKNGKTNAGSWTVRPGYGSDPWYPAASLVPPHSFRSFQITADGKVLVTIPAS